jgi:hypothetical protein
MVGNGMGNPIILIVAHAGSSSRGKKESFDSATITSWFRL